VVGRPYSVIVDAVGEGQQTWSLASGQLPAGLALDGATGTVRGAPLTPGTFSFELAATDSKGHTTSISLAINVSPKLRFATRVIPAVHVGRPYRARVRTTGGVGSAKFRVVSGRLPVGVRLNSNTAVLSGRPRHGGVFRITIEARDAIGETARQLLVLTVRTEPA
jgi:hypothetical protein